MKIRTLYASIVILTLLYLVFGYLPKSQEINTKEFSAERVAKKIEVISKDKHSLFRDENRKKVENYLTSQLAESNVSPKVFSYRYYDTHISKDTLNLNNIFLEINPTSGDASSYIMLVAHYDSAERLSMHSTKGEPSYGAADDGYGIGVILELLNNSLKTRNQWKQGIKILFTDGEEFGLLGMKHAWEHNRELFNNVGLLINIEARGMKGPALLFETSNFNSKILDLYSQVQTPAAYSLSNTVYKTLPNITDFTIVKNSINGVNFSVIDNLYYYHTPNDKFENISLKSIQHYGEQIGSMVNSFLTEQKYSSPEYFKSDKDYVYFTIPIMGLFSINNSVYIILNICFLLVTLFVFILMIRFIHLKKVLKYIGIITAFLLAITLIGVGISYILGNIFAVNFRLIGMVISEYDSFIMLSYYIIATIIFSIILYKRCKFQMEFHFAAILFNSLLILTTTILFPDNFFILIPTTISLLILILRILLPNHTIIQNILSIIALSVISLTIIPIIYILSVGLAIGAMGIAAIILYLSLIVTMPIVVYRKKNI